MPCSRSTRRWRALRGRLFDALPKPSNRARTSTPILQVDALAGGAYGRKEVGEFLATAFEGDDAVVVGETDVVFLLKEADHHGVAPLLRLSRNCAGQRTGDHNQPEAQFADVQNPRPHRQNIML